jgi:hypothetical protein
MSAGNKMVSIGDDDVDIISLFNGDLKGMSGITIFTLQILFLALEHIPINKYAHVLVMSDFKIPGPNGLEFLRR